MLIFARAEGWLYTKRPVSRERAANPGNCARSKMEGRAIGDRGSDGEGDFSKTVEIGRDFFNAIRPSLAWQGLYPELLRMSPPPVWISPPLVTLPKGWCTQSTHLPHYGTVGAKRQPFRARLLSAWRGEARRGVVLGRFAPTTKASHVYITWNDDTEHRRSVFSTLFENRIGARWAAKKGGWKGERLGEIGRRRGGSLTFPPLPTAHPSFFLH